eukprot:CAMPEP_0181290542 /NCGR_PEP_ID=MMETSP1101-20121128/1468_1 /TAXON_ID=46948 /ORGANISM="Rhodomonas abbreviata, Strain Caron Lab Isolate" /LENGTH=647 /DNA_ID=CAMNT_0023394831 /DNA_START=91 /DNA_END=2031 /DNA_ORIENTATION=+
MVSSDGDGETLDALQLNGEICAKVHKYPDDLELLNEVACFSLIYDFSEMGNPKKVWASAAWLSYVDQTLEDFQQYDFAGNTSEPIKRQMFDLGQEIQIKRKAINLEHTAYPSDRPVRLLLMQKPIVFEGMKNPLILVQYYNCDNSLVDDKTKGDPLDFNFQGEVCKKVHEFPRGLELLDEVPCFALIYDFYDYGNPKKYWANATWLKYTGQSMQEFENSDFGFTSLTAEQMQFIGKEVQVERKTVSFETTIYPRNKLLRVLCVFRPLLLQGMEHPQIVCNYLPPQPHAGALDQAYILFQEQVTNTLDQTAIFFDWSPGDSNGNTLWSNFSGRVEYGLPQGRADLHFPNGELLSLSDVLDTCDWSSSEQEKAVIANQLRELKLGSRPIRFTAQKHRLPNVWHQFMFVRCKSPHTGGDTMLLQESDVSELMHIQARLRTSNELKDRFLQCVSHELRTPLHGIIGLSSTLLVSPDCNPRTHRLLTTIIDAADRLNLLVNDILETSACMSGSLQLEFIPVNLDEICRWVCDRMRPKLKTGVTLENRIGDVGVVKADAFRLQKIFAQLLDNALKFTSDGVVAITAEREGAFVRVSVADTGCGIAPGLLNSIWEFFQQGDMSVTREHQGMGLGLALVQSQVRAHGGDVDVQSE